MYVTGTKSDTDRDVRIAFDVPSTAGNTMLLCTRILTFAHLNVGQTHLASMPSLSQTE